MNVQIFGTKKSFDTKKAQRFFKERRIKVQFIDLKEKEMSKGELTSPWPALRQTARKSAGLGRTHRAQRQKGHRWLLPRCMGSLGVACVICRRVGIRAGVWHKIQL